MDENRESTVESPSYDVALSFLAADEDIASAIHKKLFEGLNVFYFPRSQDELAGTDGLESMRQPFFDSRVMVVLFREAWGKTPWTRVEETAIKESCLENGWERLFFVALEKDCTFPPWLPKSHVRFNFADYGLVQAIGAIKARVQENGGVYQPLTPMRRAEMLKEEELFRQDKLMMNSDRGYKAIFASVTDLFREIDRQCAEISAKGHLQIKWGSEIREGSAEQTFVITTESEGMIVSWYQPYSNVLDDACLTLREFHCRLIVPGENLRYVFETPKQVRSVKYQADLSRGREYGWSQNGDSDFTSSPTLAGRCVIQFLDLVDRHGREKMERQLRH